MASQDPRRTQARTQPGLLDETIRALQTRIGAQRRRRQNAPDETLLQRRPLYVIAAALIIGAFIVHQPLLVVAGLLVGVVAVVPELWYRYGLRGLKIQRVPAVRQVMFGDEVDLTLTVENRQILPLPWLEIADEFPEALPLVGTRTRSSHRSERVVVTNALGMWAYQRARRRFRLRCLSRGAYRFGPMTVRMSDPFGMLTRNEQLAQPAVLVVYPLVAPLERLGLPPHSPFGEQKSSLRLLEDPLRVAGVRPYLHGDEPRRIHWKATARAGALQSKIYEPATQHSLAIFLDVRTFQRALYGYDPVLAELAITAAASVANWALEQDYAVGLYANSVLAAPEMDDPLDGSGADQALAAETARGLLAITGEDSLAPGATDDADDPVRRLRGKLGGTLRLRIPPASNPAQLTRILDGLARLLPFGGLPMEQVLTAEEGRLPLGTTVVYIGAEPAVDVPMIVALRRLKTQGHAITLLLTSLDDDEAASEDSGGRTAPASAAMNLAGLDTHRLGGRETWEKLIADMVWGPSAGESRGESYEPAEQQSSGTASRDGGNGREGNGGHTRRNGRAAYARTGRALVVR